MGLYADRFQRLTRQATYQRAIRTRGLVAILEPYTLRASSIPAQRTKASDTFQSVGILEVEQPKVSGPGRRLRLRSRASGSSNN